MTSHHKEGTSPYLDTGDKDDGEFPLKNSDLDQVIINPASEAGFDSVMI